MDFDDKRLEYITCAAIWVDDGIIRVHQPKNIKSGIVVAGRKLKTIDATTSAIKTPLIISQIYTPEIHECETIQRLSEKFRELNQDRA